MRLTHLKLAGFKSFVDATTLHIHGQRVGVVGPNGCGKSNVMESIRWVLGESSAREMRGDSMQDVIFNGTANRKPISRASVELLFDNSLGGAAGEWSQYAEISVKRVLHRDSGSSYYINNTPVRRRDVADLFLGTGLGGRAYAIIGQNTITRIIEAKPEELRVFLEEAAGISKYKERRRETELRLRDTRENLLRVVDILQELDKQIGRLEAQAQVAEQYRALKQSLGLVQAQCWLLRMRDAAQAWEKSQRQVARLANEVEAHVSELRKKEAALEQLRQEHYAGGETVQVAQSYYYESNAQVSMLEQQLRHAQENRARMQNQISELEIEHAKAEQDQHETAQQLEQQRAQHAEAVLAASKAQADLNAVVQELPTAESTYRDAQAEFSQTQAAISQLEQQAQLERTHLEHAQKSHADLLQRQQRLQEELARLTVPDASVLQAKEAENTALLQQIAQIERELEQQSLSEHEQDEQLKHLQQQVQQSAAQIAQLEAQQVALQKLQQALGQQDKLDAWLQHSGLDGGLRLWQLIQIEAAWETALEGVLGARINAVLAKLPEGPEQQRPPAALVLCSEGGEHNPPATHAHGWRSLSSRITSTDMCIAGVLEDWLDGVYLLENEADLPAMRLALAASDLLVNRHGDVFTRHSTSFHAAQSGLHGVLERQRELEQLAEKLPVMRQALQQQQTETQLATQSLAALRHSMREKQHSQRQHIANSHAIKMELQRLQQHMQHAHDRQQQLAQEQARLQQQQAEIASRSDAGEHTIKQSQAQIATLREQREQLAQRRQTAEAGLKKAREQQLECERSAQKSIFTEELLSNKINELNNKYNSFYEVIKSLSNRLSETRGLLQAAETSVLKSSLEQALQQQHLHAEAVNAARNALSDIEQRLQLQDAERLQAEQQSHPLRDKLEQARLQEQQARLAFEHCREQFAGTGMDENTLAHALDKATKVVHLEQQALTLEEGINELGAVNLKAIEELASERERKGYLVSQSDDLNAAIATLEDAIRRIDRETRSRLQQTFDEANRHFGELFTTLFGGGQAELQLLGEEILDTGMQVFAQPPGKKNSSIHLLSGGEKALTALALVFALFRLNPAPFCLMDEVDAPLDDSNTERFCAMVRKMSERTQFVFVSHNKITMEMAQQLIGVTMQESGVSRIVEVDIEAAMRMQTELSV